MAIPAALTEEQIYHRCPLEKLAFVTTEELADLELPFGQARVLRALEFGASIAASGFNLFVLGPTGAGKHELVKRFLATHAATQTVPSDWCHVLNFPQPDKPNAIELPAGQGRVFKNDMSDLVSELKILVPATFESEAYQSRIQALQEEVNRRQQSALSVIQQEANANNIAMLSMPEGFSFAPMRDGEVIEAEAYQALSDEEKELIEAKVEELQKQLQQAVQQVPRLRKEVRERIHALNAEMVQLALGGPMGELREKCAHLPAVVAYLDAVREDVVEHAEAFQESENAASNGLLKRYKVNLLVDNADTRGAPVVYEDLPTHQHLTGQIEHRAYQGNLYTDFTLIRAGSLHRANGGYLILDARRILSQPLAWESLKRVLFSGKIRIESLERLYGLASTVSQQPEPIALSLKVVLLGERMLYYLLSHYDPDFLELFKVEADFEDDLERDDDSYMLYARMIATMARASKLKVLDKAAVARVIEHASRLASDQKKLTAHDRVLSVLLAEANHWAGQAGADCIGIEHVQQAIDEREYRASRIRERSLEHIRRGVVMISTQGEQVGQVNGLSVLQVGATRFGQPSRITATARPGKGQVVDIEREAKLGGPIHSKAVMILSRFLASRYAPMSELSLSASLAFEQSYAGVEGDSASVAETCVLLSAITGVPLLQSLAVTGSMNQHGEVQAVGGVNEKIEGFFNVCAQSGGVKGQGVLLPASNVEHLMLNEQVREAVREGRFNLYPLKHIDQAIELLTGMQAGLADADGVYPEHSFNRRVADRLAEFARVQQKKDQAQGNTNGDKGND
jgi:lon-related putative ATP-dependent protease